MSEQEMIKKLGELTSEVEKLKANKKSLAERNMQAEKENDDLRKQIEQLESFNAELDVTVKEQTEMLNGGKLYEDYQEVCIKNSKLNATVDVLVEKISMLDIFKDQEQLEECLREWQHRLFLDGWLILAHVEDKIMNPNGEEVIDTAGYNTFVFESSQANIQLLSDESYKENNTLFKHCMEKDLVHELLHCKYDWMGCQGGTYEGVYLDATEHQKLEEMAKSLIMAKYGVGYDYFM